MAESPKPFLDGPVPGQSLTFEVGNRPWQNPPQYSTVEEAMEYYIPRLLDITFSKDIVNVLEMGVPITTIANAMQLGGVMQGYHTIDTGVLIMPVLMEVIAYLGDEAGVEYNMGTDNKPLNADKPSQAAIAVAIKRVKDKELKKETSIAELESMPMETASVNEEEEPKGLMARR